MAASPSSDKRTKKNPKGEVPSGSANANAEKTSSSEDHASKEEALTLADASALKQQGIVIKRITTSELEKVLKLLKKNDWDRTKTARILGVDSHTIYRLVTKAKKYGYKVPDNGSNKRINTNKFVRKYT